MGKFFATEGIDFKPTGWITDKGEFIACSPLEHDKIAEEKTGLSVGEVEKIWIRLSVLMGKIIFSLWAIKLIKDNIKPWMIGV